MDDYHKPVLLKEIIAELNPKSGETYLDATLGGGGHFLEIMNVMNYKGTFVGFDGDYESIRYVCELLNKEKGFELSSDNKISSFKNDDIEIYLINDNFSKLEEHLDFLKIKEVDVALADLGVSSRQIDENNVGLSFKTDTELDMRMSKELGVKAKDLINALGEKELKRVILEFGEEKLAYKIAKRIIQVRRDKRIESTFELYDLVQKIVPNRDPKVIRKTAQRVFQAFRIVVNDEMGSLDILLETVYKRLSSSGRVGVISFHSLEDRKVKNFSKGLSKSALILPTDKEQYENTRSTSAKLRIIYKDEHL